jgi:hypothetical protein
MIEKEIEFLEELLSEELSLISDKKITWDGLRLQKNNLRGLAIISRIINYGKKGREST